MTEKTENPENRRHHDMGGLAAGPVDQHEHVEALWEKRVDGLMTALAYGGTRRVTVDELRRTIEDLPPNVYDDLGYYDRWIFALSKLLVERGYFTKAELDAKLADVKARGPEGIAS